MDLVDISDVGAQTKACGHLCNYLCEFYKRDETMLSAVFSYSPRRCTRVWFQIFIAHPPGYFSLRVHTLAAQSKQIKCQGNLNTKAFEKAIVIKYRYGK